MAALFCLIGYSESAHQPPWPVCFRMTLEDAEQAKGVCEAQRERFVVTLEPVIEALHQHRHNRPRSQSNYRTQAHYRNRPTKGSREAERVEEDRWRSSRQELRDKEAEICAQFAAEMLDPLFPTSTNGYMPEDVVYKILEFWDDPREMGVAALMKLRAALHGSSDDNDDAPDEDL